MDGIRRGRALAAAFTLLCTTALAATAGNGVSAIVVRTEPNLTSVAVKAIVSGDDDSSAVLQIFQKWSGSAAAWDSGMRLVRRTGTNLHEGRILWMTPGRNLHFQVRARDAGGDFVTPTRLARVTPARGTVASGPVFHVSERYGHDAFDGTTPRPAGGLYGPKRTIGAALRQLAASPGAGRGGGVLVAPGEYHEQVVLPDFGDAGPRFLAGDGSDRDSTILCGANPWVEQGVWAPGRPLEWSFVGDSVWATHFPSTTPGSSPGDSTQLVVLGWGEYLHRNTSFTALLEDSTGTGAPESSNEGERSGWWWANEFLFVKRANGGSPVGLRMHTGYLDELVDVRGRGWRVADLTLRFAGGTSGDPAHRANPDPGLRGQGIVAGLNGTASGLVVDGCRFHGLNAQAIYVVHGARGTRADSVTITRCIVDGLNVGRMAYGAGKDRAEEDVGQVRLLSRAANVYDNVFTGGFDGLQIGPGSVTAGPRDSTWGSQVEIAYNRFSHIADDAIELDTSHAINTLLLGNIIEDAGHGISQVPIYSGPVFAIHNVVADSRAGGLKVGGSSTGLAWYVHNTIASSRAGVSALDGSPGGSVHGLHFRNNILASRGTGWGFTVWGPSMAGTTTNDFNYDLLDSVRTWRLVRWGAGDYSLPQLRGRLGWEANGLTGAPMFADSAAGDWSLLPGSQARGRGMRMAGINTSLDGPLYEGAPDIGANPGIRVTLDAGPRPPAPGLTARAVPNPARGSTTIEYALEAEAKVTVQLLDVSGRVVATLLDGAHQPPGAQRVPVRGVSLAPGLYFFQVRAGERLASGRLVILR
jgi:hypothetical protein